MNEKLTELLAEVFELDSKEINDELTNENIDSWDSLTQMDLVTSIENEFDIQLEMLDIVSMVSVKAIKDVLKDKGVDLEN